MIIGEVFGFWLLAGMAFFGWRRLAGGKEHQAPRVVPRFNDRRA